MVAKTAPKSWVEAAAALLDTMEKFERAKLDSVSELNSHEVRRKIRALTKLKDVVDAGVKAPGSRPPTQISDTEEARAVALQSVLCPANWRKNILSIFEKAKQEAEDSFIQSDLADDFEYRSALDAFIKALLEIDLTGQVARSRQIQKAVGPVVVNG